jgi:hypothetical protein
VGQHWAATHIKGHARAFEEIGLGIYARHNVRYQQFPINIVGLGSEQQTLSDTFNGNQFVAHGTFYLLKPANKIQYNCRRQQMQIALV